MPQATLDGQIAATDFEAMSAQERLAAIDRAHGAGAFLLTSLQKPSSVLMHMVSRIGAQTTLLFVDTQFHFPETLAFRDEFAAKYGLKIETVYPELTPKQQLEKYGRELYNDADEQPNCCFMRKEEPYLKAAKGRASATISSLMRAEGGKRAAIEPIGFDKRLGVPSFCPIFDWTEERIEEYTRQHGLPVHPLYAKGYLSIGCAPCTTPVLPGEDKRAGRWRHLKTAGGEQPQYCNINFTDGAGI